MKKLLLLAMVVGLLAGCTYGPRDHANIRRNRQEMNKGFFSVGMYRQAFLDEWGQPDKTFVLPSEDYGKFVGGEGMGGRRATVLDVWVYKSRNVVLIFNGLKLVGWLTDDDATEFINRRSKMRDEFLK